MRLDSGIRNGDVTGIKLYGLLKSAANIDSIGRRETFFGVANSILTYRAWGGRGVRNALEDGHAAYFEVSGYHYRKIGMGHGAWVVEHDRGGQFARESESATTYIYFKRGTRDLAFAQSVASQPDVDYSQHKPNMIYAGSTTTYHSCVSGANHLFTQADANSLRLLRPESGYWIPSVADWANYINNWYDPNSYYLKLTNTNILC